MPAAALTFLTYFAMIVNHKEARARAALKVLEQPSLPHCPNSKDSLLVDAVRARVGPHAVKALSLAARKVGDPTHAEVSHLTAGSSRAWRKLVTSTK